MFRLLLQMIRFEFHKTSRQVGFEQCLEALKVNRYEKSILPLILHCTESCSNVLFKYEV